VVIVDSLHAIICFFVGFFPPSPFSSNDDKQRACIRATRYSRARPKKIRGIASPLLASSSDFFFINIYLTPPPAPNYIYFRNIREGGEKTIYIYIYIYISIALPPPRRKLIISSSTSPPPPTTTTGPHTASSRIQSYYNHITIILQSYLYLYYIYIIFIYRR
jgi:hypothetical protein